MSLASVSEVELPLVVDERHRTRVRGERLLVQPADVHVKGREVRSAEARGGPGEAPVHDLIRESHRFEHLTGNDAERKHKGEIHINEGSNSEHENQIYS